jgi:flagellar biosynthetic protein FliQ
MSEADVLDIGRSAIWTLLRVAAPVMLTALTVGLIIALFQALTQIQEVTLTFVPKILLVFFVLMLALPFMLGELTGFTQELLTRIATLNT